jgi:vancomycin resistance protein YoaR
MLRVSHPPNVVSRPITITLIAIPLTLIAVVAGWYLVDEVFQDYETSRNVTIGDEDLSRLTATEAATAVADHEAALRSTPIPLVVDATPVVLDPTAVDLSVDVEAVIEAARTERRSEVWYENLWLWLQTWWSTDELDTPVIVDEAALGGILDDWTKTTVADPAFEGSIDVVDGEVVAEYPRPGRRIDDAAALPLILDELADPSGEAVELPLTELVPRITDADVDAAVALAEEVIDEAVVLSPVAGESEGLVFTSRVLGEALTSEVVTNSPAQLELSLNPDLLGGLVDRVSDELEIPPTDAGFELVEGFGFVRVLPSQQGKVVDRESIAGVVLDAALGSGRADIPMKDGRAPSFTTEEALAMGPLTEMSSFTTYHPCCANRVTNIQTIAGAVDGTVVFPGETFSVNEIVGQRTREKGYVAAGAIIGGRVECCDSPINIGGGTSQFATTLWNAVFFGCYEDVEHKPHSIYFSRYPYIREATLGFPYPDVKWRNDSDAIVWVDTSWTPGSITVTLYGNNGGRTCESETSGNTNTRIMTWPDGTVTTETWTWNYRPELPPTTTTTKPAPTTTAETTPATAPPTTTSSSEGG